MIKSRDLRWLSDSVRSLYTAQTVAEFSQTAIAALDAHFQPVACGVEELGHTGTSYVAHALRLERPLPADYVAYIHDHPAIPLLSSLPPCLQLRETAGGSLWEKTDHFNGIARPMGFNDQAVIRAQGWPTTVTVCAYSKKVFTDTEGFLLRLLQPHLAAAWQRVSGSPPHVPASNSSSKLRLLVSPRQEPIALHPTLQAILCGYFLEWKDFQSLPEPLKAWATWVQHELRKGVHAQVLRAFGIQSARGHLFVRYFPVGDAGAAELCLIERPAGSNLPWVGGAAKLSTREREVLHWVAQGKRDGEIAIILGLATKTVGKHTENIFRKLGVSSRTGAAKAWHPSIRPAPEPAAK
ncbi:MAG: helix-turn-helix transcriptional regulator [Verrucomicrobia bacterium]|nr:helix-turn-helix transcriptional regulator [Verrucomicrobiota bacterium]